MNDKQKLRRKIWELDFAIKELNLFLDSNPDNQKALRMLDTYRLARKNTITTYKMKYGDYICTFDDVPATAPLSWIDGPWPWEREFNEGENK